MSSDREDPSPKGAVASEAVQGCERPNESVLYDLLDLVSLSQARHEALHGRRVSLHEERGGALVAGPPALDQRGVAKLDGGAPGFSHAVAR